MQQILWREEDDFPNELFDAVIIVVDFIEEPLETLRRQTFNHTSWKSGLASSAKMVIGSVSCKDFDVQRFAGSFVVLD